MWDTARKGRSAPIHGPMYGVYLVSVTCASCYREAGCPYTGATVYGMYLLTVICVSCYTEAECPLQRPLYGMYLRTVTCVSRYREAWCPYTWDTVWHVPTHSNMCELLQKGQVCT